MDSALDALRDAATPAAQEAAAKQVVDVYNSTYPLVSFGPTEQLIIHSPNVHGMEYNVTTEVMFQKAWLSS
jgi:hypothetical protein